MTDGYPRRVDVVALEDGQEVLVVSAFLAGAGVLLTGSAEDIATVLFDVNERHGVSQTDGEAFLDCLLDTYSPSVAMAYGAWCAVRRRLEVH